VHRQFETPAFGQIEKNDRGPMLDVMAAQPNIGAPCAELPSFFFAAYAATFR